MRTLETDFGQYKKTKSRQIYFREPVRHQDQCFKLRRYLAGVFGFRKRTKKTTIVTGRQY